MINYDTPDNLFPPELRKQIEEKCAPAVLEVRRRLRTPVPGNPHGGFPGLGVITEHKQIMRAIRNEVIDKWNAENPDHELVVTAPLEVPITREEIETKLRQAKLRESKTKRSAVHIGKEHAAHIQEVLKEHPEEHHDVLRDFVKHELNTYGLKPQQYYFRRATELEAIKAKGKDPHNLMHRYEHHKETTAETDQSIDNNSETSNA